MNDLIVGICPFGCRGVDGDRPSDFDDNGYCRHLVGFITLTADQRPNGRLFERLEGVEAAEKDADDNLTGRKIHTGVMRVTGKNRQPVLDTDIVWSPEEIQRRLTTKNPKDGKIIWEPKLGLSSRVYRETGETRVVTGPDIEQHEERLRRIEDLQAQLDEDKRAAQAFDLARKGADPKADVASEESAEEQRQEESNPEASPKRRKQPVTA